MDVLRRCQVLFFNDSRHGCQSNGTSLWLAAGLCCMINRPSPLDQHHEEIHVLDPEWTCDGAWVVWRGSVQVAGGQGSGWQGGVRGQRAGVYGGSVRV